MRAGHALPAAVPAMLDENKNLLWKTPVPGRGHGSPIIIGQQIYLATADETEQVHSIVAFNLKDGKQLWKKDVNRGAFPAKNHPKNTEASPSVASDGDGLYATFYHHDAVHLVSMGMDGKQRWSKPLARFRPTMFEYGYAPSPLLYKGMVIVAYEWDGPSAVVALDRATGNELWKAARNESISFSSPVIASLPGGDQLLMCGQNFVTSLDPMTGKQLWATQGTSMATCGTVVWDGAHVYASGGFPGSETIGLDATQRGKVLWRNKEKCYEQSLLAKDGYVYALTDKGVFFCWRGTDGKEMWKQRLSGPVSASGVLVQDRIYWANEAGTLYVIRATPEKFDLLAENQVGDESFASPAISRDRILLRVAQRDGQNRQEFLYAFGNP
jgi:hypothetical protein